MNFFLRIKGWEPTLMVPIHEDSECRQTIVIDPSGAGRRLVKVLQEEQGLIASEWQLVDDDGSVIEEESLP